MVFAIRYFVLIGLVCMSSLVFASEIDREQPITIEADRVDVDDIKGLSVYRGNVVFRQGTIELLSDELAIKTTEQRELISVKATGQPARFKQKNIERQTELKGHALEITYEVDSEYMLFVGDAYFWQCGDEVTGNKVEYFGEKGLVKARRAENGNGRVQVTLQPREEGEENKGCLQQGNP